MRGKGDKFLGDVLRFSLLRLLSFLLSVFSDLRLLSHLRLCFALPDHRTNLIIISPNLGTSGQALVMVHELEDVEVTEPEWATFQCEVSVAISRPPVWTLNGEGLQPGPQVRLESSGTVHRLILKETSRDMSGVVRFTMGKAKSSAKLSVKNSN